MNKDSVYIIAEVGPNHNGDINIALSMVEKIAKTNVNAIKFQITDPFKLYSEDSFKATYQEKNDDSKSAREMSLRYQLSRDEHFEVYTKCKELGIDYICTAFDLDSLLFLDSKFVMPYYKIASGEIFSLDILEYISKQNKPIILSTGMATYEEIAISLNYLNKVSPKEITILHCISNYPAEYREVNLLNIQRIKELFGYDVGFSDHTIGNECAIAAVSLGAKMIEKHVTFDKNASGPDHKSSIDIHELANFVHSIRNVEEALGGYERIFSKSQREISKVARKSIVSSHFISKGDIITENDVCYKRPGIGILPIEKNLVIGKKAITDIEADRVIKKEFIQ